MLWLQRDFGLYLVGMFDTHQSSIVLGLPKKSLAFLLTYCCNITASKKFQTADWRMRPLPPQMERYAREDTHYLLYIYQRMRNELIRRSTKDVNLTAEVSQLLFLLNLVKQYWYSQNRIIFRLLIHIRTQKYLALLLLFPN